jgi:hypothetical protein
MDPQRLVQRAVERGAVAPELSPELLLPPGVSKRRGMLLERNLTDQRFADLPVEGGHRKCSLNGNLLISGSQTCTSRVGIVDALDLRGY